MDKKKWEELYSSYYKWVLDNPMQVTELETVVKWGSYVLAGRFKNSSVLCEVAYSASRLFEMFNDFILYKKFPSFSVEQFDRLSVLLTVIEYVEVLLEVTATQFWGETGRWATVAVIQLIKAVWRTFLLLRKHFGLITSPSVQPVDRKELSNSIISCVNEYKSEGYMELPRSGRVMRTLNGACPAHLRTFSPNKLEKSGRGRTKKPISSKQMGAELLHIYRPLGHLSGMFVFGTQSWLPWILSLCIDLTSLRLHENSVLSKREKLELVKRRFSLLYYLVRSPVFHSVTHKRINQFLLATGDKVPLARYICQPLLQYIPEWQKIYAYTWS